jgi:hypothetical protein
MLNANQCGLRGDLAELWGAKELKDVNVSLNRNLISLAGLSTEALETIDASECGLTGDHTFLAGAKNLHKLDLTGNPKSLTLDRSAFDPTTEVAQ